MEDGLAIYERVQLWLLHCLSYIDRIMNHVQQDHGNDRFAARAKDAQRHAFLSRMFATTLKAQGDAADKQQVGAEKSAAFLLATSPRYARNACIMAARV
jgi:hypothetical protein